MNLVPRKTNAIRPRTPFADLMDLQDYMSDLFDFPLLRLSNRVGRETLARTWTPTIDVVDEKDHLLVKADLPGLNKDDIRVSIEDGVLSIQGEKKEETEEKKKGYLRAERFYGSFFRSVSLPSAVDDTKVKASYKDGVLELTLPKKEEAKPKQIKVDIE